jgi:hypothetical protein
MPHESRTSNGDRPESIDSQDIWKQNNPNFTSFFGFRSFQQRITTRGSSSSKSSVSSSEGSQTSADGGILEEPFAPSPIVSPINSRNLQNDSYPESPELRQFQQLETLLHDPITRGELIDELLAKHSEHILKVRLLCAVNETLATLDQSSRKRKAKKIYQNFLREDAKYHVDIVSRRYALAIKYNCSIGLNGLRTLLSSELLTDPTIAEFAKPVVL